MFNGPTYLRRGKKKLMWIRWGETSKVGLGVENLAVRHGFRDIFLNPVEGLITFWESLERRVHMRYKVQNLDSSVRLFPNSDEYPGELSCTVFSCCVLLLCVIPQRSNVNV